MLVCLQQYLTAVQLADEATAAGTHVEWELFFALYWSPDMHVGVNEPARHC